MKKKEEKSNPIIEELPQQEVKNFSSNDLEVIKADADESSDSFFKYIVKELNNKNNISLKTEYLSVTENFVGTKLSFLSKYGNMPYLNEFIDIFEQKRVSLERKGRKEILMALQKREEELNNEKMKRIQNIMGLQ